MNICKYNFKLKNSFEEEKEEKELLKRVQSLPEVLVDTIYEYMRNNVKIFLTKDKYLFNHHIIRSLVNRKNTEEYFRAPIKRDNDFVFKVLLFENHRRWIEIKKYYHKGCIYLNYLYFIRAFCYDNESIKCIKIIDEFFEEQGLQKNQHKKKIIEYIKWT